MRFRAIVACATALLLSPGYAGDVRFYLGYGDGAFAALNGKAVGDELSTSMPNQVPGIGQTFTVSLYAVYQGTAASGNYGGGNFFLGFDTATTNNSTSGYANQGAAETAGVNKAIKLASGFSALATGLPGVNAGNDTTVDIAQLAAPKFRGEANGGSAQTLRSIGVNWSFGFGTGNSFKMSQGVRYRMVNMVVTNLTIDGNEVFGNDSGENGLTLNSLASGVASSGVNIFGSTRAGMNDATVKYALGGQEEFIVTAPASLQGPELDVLTFTAVASSSSHPDGPFTYSLEGNPVGSTIDPQTGVFLWTPSESQGPGTYSFDVVATGNWSGTNVARTTVAIQVAEVNAAPDVPQIGAQTVDEGASLILPITASDSDIPIQPITYELVSGPTGATLSDTGVFTYNPAEADGPLSTTVHVRVSDGVAVVDRTFPLTVNEINQDPELTLPASASVNELEGLNLTATASDADLPTQSLVFSLVDGPTGLTISSDGTFAWTPTEAQGPGSYAATVAVSDGVATVTKTVQISVFEVNLPPEVPAVPDQACDENKPFSLQVEATDKDVPEQTLTYSLVNPPAGAGISPTGLFSWTPSESQGPGNYTITVKVSDGVDFTTRDFRIEVREVDDPIIISAPAEFTGDEMTEITFPVSASESDHPNAVFAFFLENAPPGARIGLFSGIFRWTPTEAQGPGDYTFEVLAIGNWDPEESMRRTITVHVREVNQLPVVGALGNVTMDEQTTLSVQVTASDPDIPAQTLTYSLVGSPAGASVSDTGLITWTPTEQDGPAVVPITVVVSDGVGSSQQTFHVTVREVNIEPELNLPGSVTVPEMTELSVDASASDPDVPVQSLVFSLVSGPSGLTVNPAGQIRWTPTEDQGPGQFEAVVSVTDGVATVTKPISITVTEVNRKPKIAESTVGATIDEHKPFSLQCVATDEDLPANMLVWEKVSGPAGVALTPDGLLQWTPGEADGPGQFDVTIRVKDDGSPSELDEKVLHFVVQEVNSDPVLEHIPSQTVLEENNLTVQLSATDADLPAQSLTFSVGPGAPAGLTISASGLLQWTPTAAHGPNTYQVEAIVRDQYGAQDSQVFTIFVLQNPKLTAKLFWLDFVGIRPDHATVEFRNPGSTETVSSSVVPVAVDGSFSIVSPAPGTWDVSIKDSHWLRRTIRVNLTSDVSGVQFRLVNGDIDGDNVVSLFDYLALSMAFDSVPGDANWDPNADLDGDGTVSLFDYLILSENFDKTGDD